MSIFQSKNSHDAFSRKLEYNKIEKLHEDQFQGLVELLDL